MLYNRHNAIKCQSTTIFKHCVVRVKNNNHFFEECFIKVLLSDKCAINQQWISRIQFQFVSSYKVLRSSVFPYFIWYFMI